MDTVTIATSTAIVHLGKAIVSSLSIVDAYLRLILTSWPAVILVLSFLLLFRHRDAIDEFIKYIKLVGPKGVERELPKTAQNETIDEIQKLRDEAEKAKGEVQQEKKNKVFERLYGSMYGGQLQMLSRLMLRTMIPYAEAIQIYGQVVSMYPQLKTYDAHQYVGFLVTQGLIEFKFIDNTDFIAITGTGREFMNYVASENLTLQKVF